MQSQSTVRANVHLVVRGPDGEVKDERHVHNAVTTNGKYMIADRLLAAPTLGVPTHMAVGSGTPAANALGAQLEDRHALTSKTRSTDTVSMVGFWDAGHATHTAISEAGVFDASTSGNMHCSTGISPTINKGAGDTLTITWTLRVQ